MPIIEYHLWAVLALAILYIPAIQYKRGGNWNIMKVVAAPVALLDAYLNYVFFSWVFLQMPKDGEHTLSQRCKRLVFEDSWRKPIARLIAWYTNLWDPVYPHIPLK